MSPVPPPHMSMGPQGPQQDDCFPPHSHAAPHPTHPPPVFVIINPPPPPPQQQQAAMTAAPPAVAPPPSRPPPPPIIIKEESLPSEKELLEMVSMEEKQVEEVSGVLLSAESCLLLSRGSD